MGALTLHQDIQTAVMTNLPPLMPAHPSEIPMIEPFGNDETIGQLFVHGARLGRIAGAVIDKYETSM